VKPIVRLCRYGLLPFLLAALAGCASQALEPPPATAAPYELASPAQHLARDGRLALLRPRSTLRGPRIYLLEPFDPAKRTVVMLHGLGSSPDVWAPLVAALSRDPALRAAYQVWQVFYPTNVPIPENLRTIRAALIDVLAAVDPAGLSRGSRHVTLVGHSMGGVIARLLVVDSGMALWDEFFGRSVATEERARFAVLEPYLTLAPLPQVERAIFLAAPHRGAPMASDWRGRTASFVVRLPANAARTVGSIASAVATDTPLRAEALRRRRSSIANLSDRDDYLRATADLNAAPGVAYHSIIGRRDSTEPLAASTDGVVPYTSAHLDGAASELVVMSRHSVYDSPEAIAEVCRILAENLHDERRLP
jgi:pimeloyl-ACP methyl ester carboxylesterase